MDGWDLYRGDIVEFRRPMTYANEPTQIGRVCSQLENRRVSWQSWPDSSRPSVLVVGFNNQYAIINSDGLVSNFGPAYHDGYDGCMSTVERSEFQIWLKWENLNG